MKKSLNNKIIELILELISAAVSSNFVKKNFNVIFDLDSIN